MRGKRDTPGIKANTAGIKWTEWGQEQETHDMGTQVWQYVCAHIWFIIYMKIHTHTYSILNTQLHIQYLEFIYTYIHLLKFFNYYILYYI